METIRLNIDGNQIETTKDKTVLVAALEAGIYVPHLCHHPDLRPVGTCRLCVVDVEGMEEPCVSCTTPAADGMVVKTKTDRIDRMRRQAMESLLVDHPSECLECSQYLRCELQSVKQYLGMTEHLSVERRIRPIPLSTENPLFVHDFARCIRCGRCVRACNELRGAGVLQLEEAEGETRVSIQRGKSLAEAGCRFCGACVEVCPTGAMRDKEELVKGKRRTLALVPCRYTCPAGIDVPRYLRFIRERKFSEAAAVIREKVPFPKVLGYVCHHPCEPVCRRGQVNEAISIRDLKRFAAEKNTERLWEKHIRKAPPTGKRMAVVGSGPAGLTAAYYLARLGHGVTVFEALPFAGGMMRFGIPDYRLPRDVLESEIREIQKAGVEIRTHARIESLDELTVQQGYDAVLVAVGAHVGQKVPVPGADREGVWAGLDLLRDVNLGKDVKVGERVVVLGGGNVALDCARVALRLGAGEVAVACLESRDRMPATPEETAEGEEEGIVFHPSQAATRIIGNDGRIAGVECVDVASFEFDEEGRVRVEPVEGTEHVLPAVTVIFAVGQRPEVPETFRLETNERGHIHVGDNGGATSRGGVFAAGDAMSGAGSVIAAIVSGREAATAVDRYLGGQGEIDETLAPVEAPGAWMGREEDFPRRHRSMTPCAGVGTRLSSFQKVLETLDEQAAVDEAGRCLQCDLRLRITPVKFWGEY
ncbi:MAG: FAD-dependent oxidoreductase [Thermodesulfobacteriota bacterium]